MVANTDSVAPIAKKSALSPLALFETFYEQVTEQVPEKEMSTVMQEIFEEVQKEEL